MRNYNRGLGTSEKGITGGDGWNLLGQGTIPQRGSKKWHNGTGERRKREKEENALEWREALDGAAVEQGLVGLGSGHGYAHD